MTCFFTGCDLPAVLRVVGNTTPASGPLGVLVRPLSQGRGDPACLDHAHHAIDVMLARHLDVTVGPPVTDRE